MFVSLFVCAFFLYAFEWLLVCLLACLFVCLFVYLFLCFCAGSSSCVRIDVFVSVLLVSLLVS